MLALSDISTNSSVTSSYSTYEGATVILPSLCDENGNWTCMSCKDIICLANVPKTHRCRGIRQNYPVLSTVLKRDDIIPESEIITIDGVVFCSYQKHSRNYLDPIQIKPSICIYTPEHKSISRTIKIYHSDVRLDPPYGSYFIYHPEAKLAASICLDTCSKRLDESMLQNYIGTDKEHKFSFDILVNINNIITNIFTSKF